MHLNLSFDLSAAVRRVRRPASVADASAIGAKVWKSFPYGNRLYRYDGAALQANWARLHRGDREPFPSATRIERLVRHNPALAEHVRDPARTAACLEQAWRAYHAGDFAESVHFAQDAGVAGTMVAVRAAAVYAAHVEDQDDRRLKILREATEAAEELVQVAPVWANAWYAFGLAVGRYSQNLSVMKALTLGFGGKVRDSFLRALALEPDHADAHLALGVYHAEVVDKVGSVVGALSHHARRDAVEYHFELARRLTPDSPIVLAEYAKARMLAFGAAQFGRAYGLFQEAAACRPVDALERLDVELAKRELI